MRRLYPREQHWWSFADYDGLVAITLRAAPATVLEFGPGSSTLALIEGGAGRVATCEDDRKWIDTHVGQFIRHPVTFHHYVWSDPLSVPGLDGERFSMAFIDGPRLTTRRPTVLRYCLERCDVVVCPAEGPMPRAFMAVEAERIAAEYGRKLEWVMTGPLTYAMAVITC